MSEVDNPPAVWAVVELFGHVKLAGRLSEEEKFGAKMGRLDIPRVMPDCTSCKGTGRVSNPDEWCRYCNGFATQFFGGGSVYRITVVTEDVARHVAAGNRPQPVSPWDFPKQLAAGPVRDAGDDGDRGEDEDGLGGLREYQP